MKPLPSLLFIPLCAALAGCGHPSVDPKALPMSAATPVLAGQEGQDAGNTGSGSDAGSGTGPGATSVQGSVGGTALVAKEAFYFYQDFFGQWTLTFGLSDHPGTCALLKQGQTPANAVVAFVQLPRDGNGPLPVGDYPYQGTLPDGGNSPSTFNFGGFQALNGTCQIVQQVEATGGDLQVLTFTAGESSDATLELTFPSADDHLAGSLHATYCDLPPQVDLSGCGQ